MKFIGLFLMLISAIGLQNGFSFSNLGWFLVGLAFVFFEIITYSIKHEINWRYKNRR
jgi:hypothetical protein